MGMDYGSSAASSTVTQFTLWDTHECRRRTEACPFVRPDCSWDTSDDGCGISRQPVCPSRTGCCFIPCRQECVNARDATLIKVTGTIARGLRWWLGRSCGPCLHRRLRKEKNHGSNSSPTMHLRWHHRFSARCAHDNTIVCTEACQTRPLWCDEMHIQPVSLGTERESNRRSSGCRLHTLKRSLLVINRNYR